MEQWQSLKRKTAGNLAISAATALGTYGTQFAVNIVIARWLLPAELGVIGMALVITALAMQVGDFGTLAALVQRKELERKTLETAYALRAVAALSAVLIAFLVSPWVSSLTGNAAVGGVIRLLSLIPLVNLLGFIPQVLLTRALDYRRLGMAQLAGSLAGGAATVVLAKFGWSFWSIAVGQLGNAAVAAACYRCFGPAGSGWGWDTAEGSRIVRFGWGVFLPSLLVFVIMNIDNFIVGAVRGVAELGLYTVAFNWGSMMPVVAAVIVHRVLSPTLCRLQEDRQALRAVYRGSLAWIAFIAVPCNLLLALCAEPFLVELLGRGTTKWLQAKPVFVIFCIYGIVRVLLEPVANVFTAIGRTDAFILPNLAAAAAEAALVYPAAKLYGIKGVAIVVIGAYLLQYPFYLRRLREEISFNGGDFIRITTPPLAAGMVMTAVIMGLSAATAFPGRMFFAAVAGIAAYLLVHGTLTDWRLVGELRGLAAKRLERVA